MANVGNLISEHFQFFPPIPHYIAAIPFTSP
jgi:hypothetical protein